MLTVVQRVSRAAVRVDGEVVGEVGRGAMLLVAVEKGDGEADALATARKIASLRFFPHGPPGLIPHGPPGLKLPDKKPMDLTLAEVGGGCLVVSQFTLAGSLRKGRRPSFDGAEAPERARELYEAVAAALRAEGLPVAIGRFAAHMEVELVNDGPVTFLLRAAGGQIQ